MPEKLKNQSVSKSYVKIVTEDGNLLLFWHPELKKYTYLGSTPQIDKPEKPMSAAEYLKQYPYDFLGEATKTASTLGYNGRLQKRGNVNVVDELRESENVGVDQFAFLQDFEAERISEKEAKKLAKNYHNKHPNEPEPILISPEDASQRDDIYEGLKKSILKENKKK